MKFLASLFFLLASLLFAGTAWWLQQPLSLTADTVELTIEPGTGARTVVRATVS